MTSIEHRVELLRSVSIFAHTDTETLHEIASLFDTVEFEKDERIIESGQDGDCMFIIIDGRVQVHEGEVELTVLEKSGIIGEMELMSADPHVTDATALEPLSTPSACVWIANPSINC
jgi:CRP-like cAMP-binding protein